MELDEMVTQAPLSENAFARYLSFQQEEIQRSPVTRVPIDSLVMSGSPRTEGEDTEHIRTLAESGRALPPIMVHMPSRNVIDGMHRIQAAILRGERDIEAQFFHGSETDVFLLSVAANNKHGLPLSRQDRIVAAERTFALHPEWSDRMVAIVVGLSHRKIAAVRREAAGHSPQPLARIGRDGKARPVDGVAGRERAAKLITSAPDASLRQIAREAGISPATVADVRDRLRRGEDPIPRRHGMRSAGSLQSKHLELRESVAKASAAMVLPELISRFDRLRKDPSLRFNEAGRTFLRMFDACQAVVHQEEVIKNALPAHRLALAADLCDAQAEVLQSFAAGLRELQTSEVPEDGTSVG
jgi:hypothetical protein